MTETSRNILYRIAFVMVYAVCGVVMSFAAGAAPADNAGQEISIDLQVYYRQNVVELEPGYKDNELRLSDFVRKINQAIADSSYRVQDIVIRSAASPEGTYEHNVWLSENRGLALKRAVQMRLSIPDSSFVMDAVGEDWEGLRDMIRLYDVPRNQEVQDILDRYLTDTTSQPRRSILCKQEIKKLDDGKVWTYLYENIFPYLRNAGYGVKCHLVPVSQPAVTDWRPTTVKDTIYIVTTVGGGTGSVIGGGAGDSTGYYPGDGNRRKPRPKKKSNYRFALKTNMLFDLALCPNIEAEFPIGKRFSLLAEYNFPWYTYNDNRYAYQIQMGSAELRCWFGDRKKKSVLTGWFTGLYGSYGYGDMEWNSKGYQCKGMWHAGLSFGYSFPIGKLDNWRIEASMAVGYAPIKYDYYERSDYYKLLMYKNSGNYTWIGPTKLKCSIVWMIPSNKKAGKQATSGKK